MTPDELALAIKEFVREAYPDMEVRVEDGPLDGDEDVGQRRVYFVEPMFATLYPLQRFNYLVHLFPADFYDAHLARTDWFELAPGEEPDDLVYPDDDEIEPVVERTLEKLSKAGFFELMDDEFSPIDPDTAPAECFGDFRHVQRVFARLEFTEKERWEAAHVLMHEGAYCDCDVLFTLVPESRTAQRDAKTHGEHGPVHGHPSGHDHDH